jgi:homoserine O-acetyltransferase/O-succinyltransferase
MTLRSVLTAVWIASCFAIAPTFAQAPSATTQNSLLPHEIRTGLQGQNEGDFIVKKFRFKSGEVLPDLRLHYATLGHPHRNAAGAIDNAILLLHSTGGSTTEFFDAAFSDALYGAGSPLDLSKFYIVIPDAIGHGKSSKPSDGLRAHFPHYDYEDMVAAQHLLVTEKLGIRHLVLVLGLSMGGMQTWLWGERYPDMMDALVPISALPVEIGGRNRLWRRVVIESIRNDPEWKNGDYVRQPHGYSRIVPLVVMMVTSPVRLYEQYPTRAAADAFYDQLIQRALKSDENDRLYQYDASRDYNPAPDLEKIKAKLLAIVFADDQINSPEFAALEHEMPRVRNGRYAIVPPGPASNGEGNNNNAGIWRAQLEDLLRSLRQ